MPARLLIDGPQTAFVLAFGLICVVAQSFARYSRYVQLLKWPSLSLFAYVAALAAVGYRGGKH
jgi:hypothetical protein